MLGKSSDSKTDAKVMRRNTVFWVMIIIALSTIWTFSKKTGGVITVGIDKETIGITTTGQDPVFVFIKDIDNVELRTSIDQGNIVSGLETDSLWSGIFSNDEFGNYDLRVYPKTNAYIVIKYKEKTLVFNCSSVKKTKSSYDDIENLLD